VSWEVVTTLKEPLPLTLAFVAHHLEMGAKRIHLFLDDPNDPALPYLEGITELNIRVCDDAFWNGQRPKIHNDRQRRNANLAFAACQADWLLHCDADEFLEDGPAVGKQLDAMPQDVLVAGLRVRERCFVGGADETNIFSGWGRLPILGQRLLPKFYGRADSLLHRGMCGYSGGKSFVRRNSGLFVGNHDAHFLGADKKIDHSAHVGRRWLKRQKIVHFDGLSPRYTAQKMLYKPSGADKRVQQWRSKRRQAQIEMYEKAEMDPRELFYLLRTVPPHAVRTFKILGRIRQLSIDPAGAAKRRWPDADTSYSMKDVDALCC